LIKDKRSTKSRARPRTNGRLHETFIHRASFNRLYFELHPLTEGPGIRAGFVNGNDYLELDANEKRAYAMGAIDGLLVAPLLSAPEAQLKRLHDCTLQMNDRQVVAIITKYLRDNPAKWHHPMNLSSFNAMRMACPKPRTVTQSLVAKLGWRFQKFRFLTVRVSDWLKQIPESILRCLSEPEGNSGVATTSNLRDALPALSTKIFIELRCLWLDAIGGKLRRQCGRNGILL
jgi:hypothetical protein